MKMRIKKECDKCKKKYNHVHFYKGKALCPKCWKKEAHIINIAKNRSKIFTLEKALNQTYEVKGYLNSNNYIQASCNFPQILVGHKFKIQLIK